MRGGRTQQLVNTGSKTDAVERAKAEHKENCELRLAKIQNGADPKYKNGTPYSSK